MAVSEASRRFQDLRLNTGRDIPRNTLHKDEATEGASQWTGDLREDGPSEYLKVKPLDSINDFSSTPPIPIAIPHRKSAHHGISAEGNSLAPDLRSSPSPSLDDFIQNRRPSVTFDTTLKLDTGERRQMQQPLERFPKYRPKGSSLLQSMAEGIDRQRQSFGEAGHYRRDPIPIRNFNSTANREPNQVHLGQLCHAISPANNGPIAREPRTDLSQPVAADTTQSLPIDAARTPTESQNDFAMSPAPLSPDIYSHSFSGTVMSRPNASHSQTAGVDFFSRASQRRSPIDSSVRQSYRRSISSSTRSPRSAASSFLGSFSRSRPVNGQDGCDSLSPDAEGQTVGDDYVLGKQIGFGGFSVIKEAFHMNRDGSQRKVAVKIVRRNIRDKSEMENEQAQGEFDHEVQLWRFIKHRCILPLDAVYKTEDATFCFTPLNTGGTLFDAVRANRSGLPLDLAKHYTYQLATAIRFLHEDAHVAHRDIKLENCLVDTTVKPARIRLCDFGMAEWVTDDSMSSFDRTPPLNSISADRSPQRSTGPSESNSSAFAGGSLEYAAPEIVRRAQESSPAGPEPGCSTREVERGIVSPAGDMWAFGVCVYTLIVGTRPFQGSFSPRVVTAILSGDWDQGQMRDKGGEEPLNLVRGCLEVDIEQRWDSACVLKCEWLGEEVEKGGDEQDGGAMNVFGKKRIW